MSVLLLIISISSIDIQSPVDGFTYQEDTIALRCYVGDSIPPQLFWYYLNSEGPDTVERTITDWYTYCQNDTHTGYSKSPVPDDPPILWKKDSISCWHAFCQPVIVNGIVYWATWKLPGTLYAFRAYDGYELWRVDSIGRVDDAVTYHKGRIYCLSEDSIWCIDAQTGSIVWSKSPGSSSTTPAVRDGRVYYSTYNNDSSFVYCRNDTTGNLIWKDTVSNCQSNNTITLWQDRLYCPFPSVYFGPDSRGKLICFDATNGDIIWERSDSFDFWDSAPLIADSTLFIGSELSPYQLLALDPFTGATIWKNTLDPFLPWTEVYLSATPTYHQGRVFIGLESMYCIDAQTGETIWEYSLMLDYVHNTNVIADGCIITNNCGGYGDTTKIPNLLVIDEYTGHLKWYREYSNDWSASAPSIADGVIYIAPGDSTFYAYGTGLKFVYEDQLLSLQDTNNLIVFAKDSSGNILSDTIEFFVNMGGLSHYRRTNNEKSLLTAVSSNPFIQDILIEYTILKKSSVRLSIYDVSGKEVRILKSGVLTPGTYRIRWKGRDNQGDNMPQGVYFLRMDTKDYKRTLKLVKLF